MVELRKANEYAIKKRKRMCCLWWVLVVVAVAILLPMITGTLFGER